MSCEFKTWKAYWEFEQAVKFKNRYIKDTTTDGFLSTVLCTAKSRQKQVRSGRIFLRSQLGHGWMPEYHENEYVFDIPCPFPPERMTPLKNMPSEGRANPKGIPYLYLATNKETAMAEVRPWIGSFISVGQFKTLRNLRLIDCSKNLGGEDFFFEEPPSQEWEKIIWSHIDHAFSKPVNPSDIVADYVLTQLIAELFKSANFDGIIYRSSLGTGLNVVLFDIESAEIIKCSLFAVKAVSFDFQETTNPYFLRKHYRKDSTT